MKDIGYDIIQIILNLAFIVGIVIGLFNRAEWNNGYCGCGGHWVYEQAVGHRMKTSYIYRCDECGKIIEIWNANVTKGGVEDEKTYMRSLRKRT